MDLNYGGAYTKQPKRGGRRRYQSSGHQGSRTYPQGPAHQMLKRTFPQGSNPQVFGTYPQGSGHQGSRTHPQGPSHRERGTHPQGPSHQECEAYPQGFGPQGLVGQSQSNQQNQTSFAPFGALSMPTGTGPENIHGAQPSFGPQAVGNLPSYPGNQSLHHQDEQNDFSDDFNNAELPSDFQMARDFTGLLELTREQMEHSKEISDNISQLNARLAELEAHVNDMPHKVAEMLPDFFNEFKTVLALKADNVTHREPGSINPSDVFGDGSGNFNT